LSISRISQQASFQAIRWECILRLLCPCPRDLLDRHNSRYTVSIKEPYSSNELVANRGLHSFERALRDQPSHPALETDIIRVAAAASFVLGNVLVLSSMWALGLTGTYLGDYFGILMEKRVTGFPFNVTDAPMYYGSTLAFFGTALWFGKPAGLLLTAEVFLVYKIALALEE
jgi:hypothetical protein